MSCLEPHNARYRRAAGMLSPKVLFNRDSVSAWLIFAVSLVVTVMVWQAMTRDLEIDNKTGFDRAVAEARSSFDAQMQNCETLLRRAAGFVTDKPELSRENWRRYAQTLIMGKNHPALQALVWAPKIERRELTRHIQAVRAEGFPNYTVFPVGENEDATPVAFVEPFSGINLNAFGYDMSTNATRSNAMHRARDTGLVKVALQESGLSGLLSRT